MSFKVVGWSIYFVNLVQVWIQMDLLEYVLIFISLVVLGELYTSKKVVD